MGETIFALSSGGLPSGVAVIRLSGPKTRFVLETMVGDVGAAREVRLAAIRDGQGAVIDRGLVLYFRGPHSFTGEDCAEFQLHGGRAVVQRCLEVLGAIEGLRQAEPGEFTRRAFENGKMDLTEVEGLADLIAAETEFQRRAALDQAGGRLRSLYEGWMRRLTHARAMLEAEMDFSDEGDIPGSVSDVIWADLDSLRSGISAHIAGFGWGEIVRDGFRVTLVGAPNAGKSTLINRLADREVAIVSAIPGTTRDSLEVRLSIAGYLVLMRDTAGLRSSGDEIEIEGMRRTRRAIESSDLVLYLVDGTDHVSEPDVFAGANIIRVGTKADLVPDHGSAELDCQISSVTGQGIDSLIARIGEEVARAGSGSGDVAPNRERHRVQLDVCIKEIDMALLARDEGPEIVAEHLRRAAHSLGRITGHVGVEDLLGVIFSEFCVGK